VGVTRSDRADVANRGNLGRSVYRDSTRDAKSLLVPGTRSLLDQMTCTSIDARYVLVEAVTKDALLSGPHSRRWH